MGDMKGWPMDLLTNVLLDSRGGSGCENEKDGTRKVNRERRWSRRSREASRHRLMPQEEHGHSELGVGRVSGHPPELRAIKQNRRGCIASAVNERRLSVGRLLFSTERTRTQRTIQQI